MSWFKGHHEKPLRDQLIEARDALRRQINVLDAGPLSASQSVGEAQQFSQQAAELRAMLENIQDQLAELGVSDA